MSLNKISDTEWELSVTRGSSSVEYPITITSVGIEIDGDVIHWDAIEQAKVKIAYDVVTAARQVKDLLDDLEKYGFPKNPRSYIAELKSIKSKLT